MLAIVHGHLFDDELPPALVEQLLNRLTHHGPLPDGATPGELNALLADLCQRMHWAMADDHGDYPEPMPRRTTYYLDVPDDETETCMAALTALGGEVSRHPADPGRPNNWSIAAAFPDLPPDPSHHARIAQLSALAHRHGGEMTGFGR
ncbi:hypothetical protein [Actinoplanes sp. NPDC049802]|uniref:hypothetical protein n=1 Tax=Actinoplanes sp. NPDC049802 TaxID=3154742 RepID=UPI0033F76768